MERYNEGLFTYFFGLVIYFRVHMQQLIVVVHHYPRQDSRMPESIINLKDIIHFILKTY